MLTKPMFKNNCGSRIFFTKWQQLWFSMFECAISILYILGIGKGENPHEGVGLENSLKIKKI